MARVGVNEEGRRIGDGHPRTTITDADVKRMRDMHEFDGVGVRRIARLMGLRHTTVARILNFSRRNQIPHEWKQCLDGPNNSATNSET